MLPNNFFSSADTAWLFEMLQLKGEPSQCSAESWPALLAPPPQSDGVTLQAPKTPQASTLSETLQGTSEINLQLLSTTALQILIQNKNVPL